MIAVIDYGAGNIASVANALRRLDVPYEVTADPDRASRADKIIFPGQGRAGPAMKHLTASGIREVIEDFPKPFLGICLGLQVMAHHSAEDDTTCLGLIPGTVKRFPETVKIPQIGWNRVALMKPSPLTETIPDNSYFYFVHSYYYDAPAEYLVGRTEYGVSFASIVQKDNFYATQFHPEKSGTIGMQLLRNFCERC